MTIAGKTRTKVDRLIRDFYPWGQPGYLAGSAPRRAEVRRERVERWLADFCTPLRVTALALIARVRAVLDELDRKVVRSEPARWRARIDAAALVKRPESILEKMVRDWRPDKGAPPCDFHSLAELRDLGRFRIVANFLSDLDQIATALERPFGRRGRLSGAQEALRAEFELVDGRFGDSVLLHPKSRQKGERCRKGIFKPQSASTTPRYVEVQILALLQEAWDKKDHFLVYEPRRRGEPIALHHDIEIFAMSELLYVADLTFDRLRSDVLTRRREARRATKAKTAKKGPRRAPSR